MTEVPTDPPTTSSSPTDGSDTKGSAESHYITFSGIREVQITDGQGNDNGPISTAYRKNVPGVSEMVIGANSVQIITPTNNTYTLRFVGTGSPIAIEDIRGVNNEMSNAAYVVRYTDLVIPSGRVAELRIINDRVDSLKQDVDGDGSPESIIPPGRTVTDPQSADMQAPKITVSWGPVSPNRSVSVVATDKESGVRRIFYRAGTEEFQEVASDSLTFTVQGGPPWSVEVAAEDNAGNRSDVVYYPGCPYFC